MMNVIIVFENFLIDPNRLPEPAKRRNHIEKAQFLQGIYFFCMITDCF